MHRRRLGEAYGAAPDSVTIDLNWNIRNNEFGQGDWLTKLDLKPMFVGCNLIFHATHRMIVTLDCIESLDRKDRDTRSVLVDELRESSIGSCHCSTPTRGAVLRKCADYIVSDIDFEVDYAHLLEGFRTSKPHSCPNCLTQYVFTLYRHPEAAAFEIIFDTWTNLGECRWTFSPEWLSTQTQDTSYYSTRKFEIARQKARAEGLYPSELLGMEPRPSLSGWRHASMRLFGWRKKSAKLKDTWKSSLVDVFDKVDIYDGLWLGTVLVLLIMVLIVGVNDSWTPR
ncbi:hypothetical protein E4T39_00240 [Aureobasidium subglaciale]|nr:hypothetical protein E4T39_00240 [Aureobasidium subglaciale]